MVTFFFASAAASAAYLTAGEIFPLEIRALAIAFFFAIGTGIGGVVGPWWFAWDLLRCVNSVYVMKYRPEANRMIICNAILPTLSIGQLDCRDRHPCETR